MISSFQCITALGPPASLELCPVSLSKWTWCVNMIFMCHHPNRAGPLTCYLIGSDQTELVCVISLCCSVLSFSFCSLRHVYRLLSGTVKPQLSMSLRWFTSSEEDLKLANIVGRITLFTGALSGVQPHRCEPWSLVSKQTPCSPSWKLHVHCKMGFEKICQGVLPEQIALWYFPRTEQQC